MTTLPDGVRPPGPIAPSISKAIHDAIQALPEGKRGAIVAFVDQDGTVRAAITARLDDHWQLVGVFDKPIGQKPKASAAVQFSW
jgi:hypothetical protein